MSSLSNILTSLVASVQLESAKYVTGKINYEEYIQNTAEYVQETMHILNDQDKELLTNEIPY